jgi:hypothetical protein
LSLNNEEIVKLIDDYEKETKAIRKNILKLIWYMRGSISYDEGMLLSDMDRELIAGIIESNLETTKETNLPFF